VSGSGARNIGSHARRQERSNFVDLRGAKAQLRGGNQPVYLCETAGTDNGARHRRVAKYPGTLPCQQGAFAIDMSEYVQMAERGITPWDQIATLADGLRGLEQTRRIDLEDWMDRLGLDAVLFPTVADVGPANADVDPQSADIAWRAHDAVIHLNVGHQKVDQLRLHNIFEHLRVHGCV